MRSNLLLLLVILVLFSMGCITWAGDRPVYYQRIIDNRPQFVPGHPKTWDDPIQKQVMIGNPFEVDVKLMVHCDDWSWRSDEVRPYTIKPQKEFSALVDSTRGEQWEQACQVKSWKSVK